MILHVVDRIAYGAYADIYRHPRTDKRVVKVFRRKRLDSTGAGVRAVFEAELKAQRIAATIADLAPLVPVWWGLEEVEGIVGRSGDLSARYHLEFNLVTELVDGPEEKLVVYGDYEWVIALAERFAAHGIGHILDASVFAQPDGTFRIIDFATHDAASVNHTRLFDRSGGMEWDVPDL